MTMRQLLLDLAGTPPPTFGNFVSGRNAAAVATLHAFGTPALADRCVYLWGAPGSGRTHLLAAWRDARAADPRCVAVDDVENLADARQIELFNLYNRARAGDAWLLVAGRAAPAALTLRDDLKSRLAWGLGFELQPLSDAEKRDALLARATAAGMPLPAEMIDYLLARVRRDMPSLIAIVDALDRLSLETKRPVTLPLLRDLLNRNQALSP